MVQLSWRCLSNDLPHVFRPINEVSVKVIKMRTHLYGPFGTGVDMMYCNDCFNVFFFALCCQTETNSTYALLKDAHWCFFYARSLSMMAGLKIVSDFWRSVSHSLQGKIDHTGWH